jgi:hypothetical protein
MFTAERSVASVLSASGNVAMRSAWVDNIYSTPYVVRREMELTETMVVN